MNFEKLKNLRNWTNREFLKPSVKHSSSLINVSKINFWSIFKNCWRKLKTLPSHIFNAMTFLFLVTSSPGFSFSIRWLHLWAKALKNINNQDIIFFKSETRYRRWKCHHIQWQPVACWYWYSSQLLWHFRNLWAFAFKFCTFFEK